MKNAFAIYPIRMKFKQHKVTMKNSMVGSDHWPKKKKGQDGGKSDHWSRKEEDCTVVFSEWINVKAKM